MMDLGSIGPEACNLNILHPWSVIPFTSISASWMNMIEWFSLGLSEERLRRGVFTGVSERIEAVEKPIAVHNNEAQIIHPDSKAERFPGKSCSCQYPTRFEKIQYWLIP